MHFTLSPSTRQFTVPRTTRVIHLIDAENLGGSPRLSAMEAAEVRRAYAAVAPAGARDMTILATSHFAAPRAWMAWPGPTRRLVRSGVDGADLALLDVIASERLHLRFDHVVIGSGDGIFAMAASRLQLLGCPVTVVSRCDGLSRQLRLAVRDVRFIDERAAVVARHTELGRAA